MTATTLEELACISGDQMKGGRTYISPIPNIIAMVILLRVGTFNFKRTGSGNMAMAVSRKILRLIERISCGSNDRQEPPGTGFHPYEIGLHWVRKSTRNAIK